MKSLILGLFVLIISLPSWSASVFYLGDSHSYIWDQNPAETQKRFGNKIIDHFNAQNDEITYYAACGASPRSWVMGAKTTCGFTKATPSSFEARTSSIYPPLKTILNPDQFDRIIINLGDNMFDWKSARGGKRLGSFSSSYFQLNMKAIIDAIPDLNESTCAWIGPTYHVEGSTYRKPNTEVDKMYENLEMILDGKCRVIDSRKMVNSSNTGDGLHHSTQDSQLWALGVLSQL